MNLINAIALTIFTLTGGTTPQTSSQDTEEQDIIIESQLDRDTGIQSYAGITAYQEGSWTKETNIATRYNDTITYRDINIEIVSRSLNIVEIRAGYIATIKLATITRVTCMQDFTLPDSLHLNNLYIYWQNYLYNTDFLDYIDTASSNSYWAWTLNGTAMTYYNKLMGYNPEISINNLSNLTYRMNDNSEQLTTPQEVWERQNAIGGWGIYDRYFSAKGSTYYYVQEITYNTEPLLNANVNVTDIFYKAPEYMSFQFSYPTGSAPTPTPEGGGYEVVDIPGLMFYILAMPFAFVSQAFNLTLFPGTQYALPISDIFLAVFYVLILIWILKKVWK